MDSKTCVPWSRRRARLAVVLAAVWAAVWARFTGGRGMPPGAGRYCTPKELIATAVLNPAAGCCCGDTAWFSAICWCVKQIFRAGVNYRLDIADLKTAAKCAVAASSMD